MDKSLRFISIQSKSTREENEFLARNQCHFTSIFSGFWLLYCWWLSAQCNFHFGQYTTILLWLFCAIHVLTVWTVFQYTVRLLFRIYQLSRRLGMILVECSSLVVMTFVLFLLLTFVLNLRQFLRDMSVIVN